MITTVVICIAAGILLGGIIAWLVASARFTGRVRSSEAINDELRNQIQLKDSQITQMRRELDNEKHQRVKAITELSESLKNLEEQKSFIETMKGEMKDTFHALSSAALKSSSDDFLKLASERLGKIVSDTKGKLGEHQTAMDGLIKPLQDALKKYEEQINAIEAKRRQDYGGIEEQIKMLATTHQQLQRETSSLVNALRKPQVSGSWGQLSLKRASELAGMTAHCDFFEEVSVSTETGRLRPDMIVRLPNGREIVVDAKAPVDAYLNAISSSSDEERKKKLANYVSQVRAHMNSLGSKSYWEQFPKSPEIVVMYLPGESFFSAALEHDHRLIEDSSLKKVVLATPTTFIALLKAIAYGWQQEQITRNARRISELGKELYDRMNTITSHFDDIGGALARAIIAFNKAVGSLESRVLPSVRKFKELGVTGGDEIPDIKQIDQTPRDRTFVKTNTDED
jgi:DNA recombination protein RmuC